MDEQTVRFVIQISKVGQKAIFEINIEVTGIKDEIGVLFEEVNREWFGVGGINEIVLYFVDSEEGFPLLTLGGILCNFGVELFWDEVEGEAVVCGEDEFLFEPELFLELFDVGEEIDNLGGYIVNRFRYF